MTKMRYSWIDSANERDCPFPLNNLPLGVFSSPAHPACCGVAIGNFVFNLTAAEADGLIKLPGAPLFEMPAMNRLMSAGPSCWHALRERLEALLAERSEFKDAATKFLTPLAEIRAHMPFIPSEFTDFYSGRHHAENVGTMLRGPENKLPPNWLHMPIGYNGRASSIVVSGTPVRRPFGQIKPPDDAMPKFAPSARFDFELELGAIVGVASHDRLTVQEADDHLFGYVLLNDWSARDFQAWEYQPLGPFQAKASATSISPWIVMKDALEPFRASAPAREFPLLSYLEEPGAMLYDIALEVRLQPQSALHASAICQTNFSAMYYSSAQQLAHHSACGCPMNVADLLGTGTISGAGRHERGSLLELSWGGKEPIILESGETRSFLEDGDIVTFSGAAKSDSYMIGFGECSGQIQPAAQS